MLLFPENATRADFCSDTSAHLKRLSRTRRPTCIVHGGRLEAVVLTGKQYRDLIEKEDRKALDESIRQFDAGMGIPWSQAKRELRRVRGAHRRSAKA